MLQAGRSLVRFVMLLNLFSNVHNPSSPTMALELSQPLTEMSTRNLPMGKARPPHKSNNLTEKCVRRLSREYGSLDISHPARPVTRIALI
jgi:hypothetical protein